MKKASRFTLVLVLLAGGLLLAACAAPTPTQAPQSSPTRSPEAEEQEEPAAEPTEEPALPVQIAGDVVADGSSTVYPITVAVAEEFAKVYPDVRVSVGLSGTGGGFKKFCAGETDISDASRPIKDEEAATCEANGIEYTELLVALDGLTVMVNPANDFVECLSPEQLVNILGAGSAVVKWSDIDPAWPDETIQFFIPDPDSGTRDYMVEVIEGFGGPDDLRSDENTTFSSDDNILLDGIANNENALGFFGFAYYINNTDVVRAVAIQNKNGECVLPSDETVQDGSYNPLSRPLFIYVNNASAREKPQVAEFVKFYLGPQGAPAIMANVGYSLPPAGTYEDNLAKFGARLGE